MDQPITEEQRRRRALVGATATIAVFVLVCGVAVYFRLETAMPRANQFAPTTEKSRK